MSDEQLIEGPGLQDNETIAGKKPPIRRTYTSYTRVVPVRSIGEQVHKNVQQYHKQLELLNQLKQVKLLKTWKRNGRPTSTYRKQMPGDVNDDIKLGNAEMMLYERIKAMDVTEYRYNPKMSSRQRKN